VSPYRLLNFYASAHVYHFVLFFTSLRVVTEPASLPAPDARARGLLLDLYTAATEAVNPGPALASRLAPLQGKRRGRRWLLALGKAAAPMAAAAVQTLAAWGEEPTGGLIVAPAAGPAPHPVLRFVAGDHPEPGAGSLAAALALGETASQVRAEDEVWVLLSGGASSLLAAPVDGVTAAELRALYALLLGSGLDIVAMNRIRKRFSRWGGGRLAAALAPACVRVFVVSDVIGDDLAAIGSGPCVPDPTTAGELHEVLSRAGLWDRVPASVRRLLASESGKTAETPKPGDRAFARVTHELIASNRLALEAAAGRAAELGLAAEVAEAPLAGEAWSAGTRLAATLLQHCGRPDFPQPEAPGRCFIWGGETTVTLGDAPPGLGGRCQELALAAARELSGAPSGVALLAAGTDGRDGPTDAAGAVVDGRTWTAAALAGRDPARDLAAHDAYRSLEAAGALVKVGLTGTNVMDVIIGLA
jgi:glycerate 2-kinase